MSGMVRIEFGNETDLQAALATVGPVAVTIDGSSKAFRVSLSHANIAIWDIVKTPMICPCNMLHFIILGHYIHTLRL